VKAELLTAGIAEHRIAVVSLGEEGVLCVDTSDVCRHMNRRVHLDIRKIGQEHMAAPVASTSTDPSEAGLDASVTTQDTGSITDSLPPSPADPSGTTPDPAAGS